MATYRRFMGLLGIGLATMLGGCAWDGPQKMAYDQCMRDWLSYESGAIGPRAEVYPKGYTKSDYCWDRSQSAGSTTSVVASAGPSRR